MVNYTTTIVHISTHTTMQKSGQLFSLKAKHLPIRLFQMKYTPLVQDITVNLPHGEYKFKKEFS